MEDKVLALLDIIDGWYHKNTRYHLVDVDPNVMDNLIVPFASQVAAAQEQAVRNAQLQTALHVLSILKATAEQPFSNVKQQVYTMHDKVWRDLKEFQATQPKEQQREGGSDE